MPKIKLTNKAIDKLRAPDPSGKQTLYWDTDLKGFAVQCSGTTNSRLYVAQRDLPDGRPRRVTIGAVSEIKLEEARTRAADALDEIRRGIDPKRRKVVPTLRSTLESYLLARKDLRPPSIRAYRGIERTLKPWMDLPIGDISREMVEDRHRALAAIIGRGGRHAGTYTANAAMRHFRLLWNFAADQTPDMPKDNPVRLSRQWYPEGRRTRMVRADELADFYAAVTALPNPIARDYLLLLLFTGMRRTEAATLRWADVDLREKVTRLPAAATKGKRSLDLPMSDFVHDMLVARRAVGDTGFVFPGKGRRGHISDTNLPLTSVKEATGIVVSVHDLRRTFSTVAVSAGVSIHHLKLLLNHSIAKDVTFGYVVTSVEDLRQPVQQVADKLKALCGIIPVTGGNVARLKK